MLPIIGILIVISCTLGGYVAMGGKLGVLWQPLEVVIIVGAAIGAYIIGNSPKVLKGTGGAFKMLFGGPKYNKESYVELLSVMFQVFKIAKKKGLMGLEKDIENPHESELFAQFPGFHHDHHAVEFLCDYLRMISLGAESPHVLEDLMEKELDQHHAECHSISHAVTAFGEGMPALGIVAAVLGVIKTMGAISEPPEVLGHMIGGALVGTFLGVWISYGYVSPMAANMEAKYAAEGKYLECLKAGLISYLHGYPPAICIEYARKALDSRDRPTFLELEEATNELPTV